MSKRRPTIPRVLLTTYIDAYAAQTEDKRRRAARRERKRFDNYDLGYMQGRKGF